MEEKEVRKILSELIQIIESTPNDSLLGEKMRSKYWDELKKIKEKI